MNELIEFATSWRSLLIAVVVFSAAPELLLRLVVLLYPREHPRRRELVAELGAVPRRERPFWVAEQLVGVTFEAAPLRAATWRRRVVKARRAPGVGPPDGFSAGVEAAIKKRAAADDDRLLFSFTFKTVRSRIGESDLIE